MLVFFISQHPTNTHAWVSRNNRFYWTPSETYNSLRREKWYWRPSVLVFHVLYWRFLILFQQISSSFILEYSPLEQKRNHGKLWLSTHIHFPTARQLIRCPVLPTGLSLVLTVMIQHGLLENLGSTYCTTTPVVPYNSAEEESLWCWLRERCDLLRYVKLVESDSVIACHADSLWPGRPSHSYDTWRLRWNHRSRRSRRKSWRNEVGDVTFFRITISLYGEVFLKA